jgi:hypothetical protein
MRKPITFTVSLCLLSLTLAAAFAGGPVFWRVATRADIERGDAQGVSIADNGALTLAPAFTEVFDTKQAYVWSVAADGAGNVYLGTGHEGRVFKVDAAGKGSLLYKTGELDVMALATDAAGNVYAGTSPDGKVYRIAPSGEAKVFFEPKTKYIWSLAFDREGRLLVGTGDKGVIFRVNPDGRGAPLVTTTQTNITALAVDSSGNIIAGTDPGGLVLRVGPDGKAFTLFDSAQREVRDLAVGRDGAVYALALAESVGSGAANAAPAAAAAPQVISADEGVTVTISDVQVLDSSAAASSSASAARSGEQSKSALYRIDQSGVTDLIWDSRDVTAFGVALDGDGRALIGTGQKGRVYSTPSEARGIRKPTLVVQSPEAQTSRFVRTPQGQLYAASSNLGKLYRLGRDTVASGTYTSSVRDAQAVATWGRVSWVGEGDIEIQTRSGNTASPDSTWSEWSPAFKTPDGGQVSSPRARYVQWRATLRRGAGGAAPSLREVTLSYLPRNLAPSISGLTVLPVGVALQAMPQQPADAGAEQAGLDPAIFGAVAQIPPRKVFQKGAISLQWTADDRNGDNIEYAVYYRAASGGEYFPLKTGLRENFYTVEANALADGRYVLKVVASDAPSNPGAQALADEEETEPVEVDNTAPAVAADAPKLDGNNVEIVFRAGDATSVIRRAEYQVDGGEWKPVFPVDGIADSRREEFRVTVTLPDARAHAVALRAFDANANVGSAQVGVRGR